MIYVRVTTLLTIFIFQIQTGLSAPSGEEPHPISSRTVTAIPNRPQIRSKRPPSSPLQNPQDEPRKKTSIVSAKGNRDQLEGLIDRDSDLWASTPEERIPTGVISFVYRIGMRHFYLNNHRMLEHVTDKVFNTLPSPLLASRHSSIILTVQAPYGIQPSISQHYPRRETHLAVPQNQSVRHLPRNVQPRQPEVRGSLVDTIPYPIEGGTRFFHKPTVPLS